MRRIGIFILLLGVWAAPLAAEAQEPQRTYRIGWLDSTGTRTESYQIAFVERLRELGFAEGRNLVIEFRTTNGREGKLVELAADLARRDCDLLLAPGTEAGLVALERATKNTPIVIVANDYDPVTTGHIASLAHPGGRITGVSQLQTELPAKRLELLKELLPRAKRIAVFADTATAGQLKAVQDGSQRQGVTLQVIEFTHAPYDYKTAFGESVRAHAEALLVLASGNFVSARHQIPELAIQHRLPSMFGNNLWARAGGLLSYGPDFSDFYRRAAEQVVRILNGARPADLPIEQPTRFELVINLRTAKALGLTIPRSLLVRADYVIQ
jgi:putative tryptophan/tyrosine transport system substrate-binding protein